jgi:DNA invertase Pin-like site-specific DNA recombinase
MAQLRCIGYVRVSKMGDRDVDDEGFQSVRQQTESIQAGVAALGPGARLVGEPVVELDRSGDDADRPRWNAMIDRAVAGEYDVIVCAAIDRFSRNPRHAAVVIEDRLTPAGVRFVAVKEHLDTLDDSPQAGFVRDMFFGIARMQRANMSAGLKASREDAKARGIWSSPLAPTGYQTARPDVKGAARAKLTDAERQLTLEPVKAPLMHQAFTMRAAGASLHTICVLVGLSPAGAAAALRNPVYLGSDYHPAIVTRAEFDAAQGNDRDQRQTTPRADGGGILRGLVRCATCGHAMRSSDGRYVCRKWYGGGEVCPGRATVDQVKADAYVENMIQDAVVDPAHPAHATVTGRIAVGDAVIESRDRLAAAEGARTAWIRDAATAGLSVADLKVGLEAATDARDAAQADLDGLLAAGAEHAHPADLTTFAEFDHLERRRVVAQFVREVRVAPNGGRYVRTPMEERVEVIWRPAPDADLVARAAAAERARVAALNGTGHNRPRGALA